MRINNNIMAINAHNALLKNTGAQSKSLEKLSSGKRINRAADDAAGLSISETMRGQIRGLQQASRNAQDGISFIQTAEGAMDEVSSMLVRLKELTVQKANGTYSTSDQANTTLEMTQLVNQINDIIDKTEVNGNNIKDTMQIAIRDNDESADATKLTSIGVDMTGGDYSDLDALTDLADESDLTSADSLTTDMVESAVADVNKIRSTLGAQQNRLESAVNNLSTTTENLQAAESRIRDTDMASEMAEFNKQNILVQAATSMLAQANSAPQAVLKLLQ